MMRSNRASAGHQLGSAVGSWFERYFVLPILGEVAKQLGLFLDHRFLERPIRGTKLLWEDEDGNAVDYDFVLELDGTLTEKGVPVGFVESFWRRGARHSKDKARDDVGKLRPMRATYPTARFLGIVAAGDFTSPAREFVLGQQIDLLYVPKSKVVESFSEIGLVIDYPDTMGEAAKQQIASEFEASFTEEKKIAVATVLLSSVGEAMISAYLNRVRAKLSALPQEFRFVLRRESEPIVFDSIKEAAAFLATPVFGQSNLVGSYVYQIVYSDGTDFERNVSSLIELQALHSQMSALTAHVQSL